MDNILKLLLSLFFIVVVSIPIIAYLRILIMKRKQLGGSSDDDEKKIVFGFFHPYCSGGGGGERVLWKMIQILQSQQSKNNFEIVIYTIDPPTTNEYQLRKDANRRFDVEISQPVKLISLEEYKDYLKPSPYLSLILESIATMKLAYQGLLRLKPDIYVDTTGCAFTFVVAKCMGVHTIMAYVHYPTISTDMMLWEWQNTKRSKLKTLLKLIYYWIFAILYGLVGSFADLVMVNSTWTYNHISSLWRFSKQIHIVYPPCRVPSSSTTTSSSDEDETITTTATGGGEDQEQHPKRQNNIVSIGQFRPEKDHTLQIQSLSKLFELYPQHKNNGNKVKLILIGSCRNDSDQHRVDSLKTLVKQLNLEDSVVFNINPPYKELQQAMHNASIGIHTMRQEHFGIGIVEMMAAGLITIAHNSGGPKSDIIITNSNSDDDVGGGGKNKTGFLATTQTEYANCIHAALTMSPNDEKLIRSNAQLSSERFSDQVFDKKFGNEILPILFGKQNDNNNKKED